MLKKSISIIVVFLIIFSLSGCVPISVIPKLNQMKQDATSKLNNYLNTEYENYEIIDVQQFTDTKNLGTTISDITKIIVKIDAQEYNFYYNHSNDKIYSNYYNNNIISYRNNLYILFWV